MCLEAFPASARTKDRTTVCSFACDHRLCRACDNTLARRGHNTCVQCRQPRKGMTAAQAAPRSDLNAPDPADVIVNELLARGFEPLFRRRPDGSLERPETGRILVFPIDRSGEAVHPPLPDAVNELNLGPNASSVSLTTLSHILPSGLVDALMDLPSVSLVEFRALARNRRVAAPRGHRPVEEVD